MIPPARQRFFHGRTLIDFDLIPAPFKQAPWSFHTMSDAPSNPLNARPTFRLTDPSREGTRDGRQVLYLRSSCDSREIGLRARYRPIPTFPGTEASGLACVLEQTFVFD
jgi:hypothetical protein